MFNLRVLTLQIFSNVFGMTITNLTIEKHFSVEFLHYLIASRSLRKAFISIKGYYFQAEVMSQTVTWLIPHNFAHSVSLIVSFSLGIVLLYLFVVLNCRCIF